MDIAEWEFYASCSRLKSERTKNGLKKKDLEKQLIRSYKRLMQIWKEKEALGYKDLVPPVQKGWKRFFVLRADVVLIPEAFFLQQLLDKINSTQYSMQKDFKVKQKQKGKKVYVDTDQLFPVIKFSELKELKLTKQERSSFHRELRYSPNFRVWYNVLAFSEPWKFVLKVEPLMITQVKVIDPNLISEEQEIENYLRNHELDYKMYKIMDGSQYKRCWKEKGSKEKYKTKHIAKLLEMEHVKIKNRK
jgi:hypothetical protein